MPEQVVEHWFYTGKRLLRGGSLAHAWLTPSGREPAFVVKGRDRFAIGGVYEATVSGTDGALSLHGQPKFLRAHGVGDEQVRGWIAESTASVAAHEMARAEKRAKATAAKRFGELTLEELRATMNKALPHHRTGLAAAVLDYLLRR
jgi:hypothetical protein